MADEKDKNLNSADELKENSADDKKSQPKKSRKELKEEKALEKEQEKEIARYKKEWEQSLIASKRVKREEIKRKLKKALLILLVISLLITSTVYVMLLFIEANNVRITASSAGEKTISLSFDKEHWSPYLDIDGPSEMTNVSYSLAYPEAHAQIPTVAEMKALTENMLFDANAKGGDSSKANVIEFSFFLENTSEQDIPLFYQMNLACDKHGLQDTIRVAWVESNNMLIPETDARIYASRSTDPRMSWSKVDALGNTYEDGGVEYIAYPVGSDNPTSWGANRLLQYLEKDCEYNAITGTYSPYEVPAAYKEEDVEPEVQLAN
ncbi:MAG: hypothetical protein MJ193_03105, partial [Clostridia bacterium]|nr:hypothetical protein [Clostridia bacterium]